jgi:hypothetical protein
MGKNVGKELKEEEIVRISKVSALQTGAGLFAQTELDTHLSIERGVIWLIHFVEFWCDYTDMDDVAAGASETETFQLTRDTKANMIVMTDADLVCNHTWMIYRAATIGTDAGPMYAYGSAPYVRDFPRPIPYAAQNIYLGYQSSNGTVKTGYCRIGYSIRTVGDKYFFRVAQALLG